MAQVHPGCTRVSENCWQASGRQQLDTSSVGTGCQLWLFRYAGVLWSPVTISTSGLSAVTRGITASNSSVRFTLAAKLPSSPVLSVYLKCRKKKSKSAQFCFQQIDLLVQRGRLGR